MMKIKFTNFILAGLLCLSVCAFTIEGGKNGKTKTTSPPKKFIDPANMDLYVKPGDDFF